MILNEDLLKNVEAFLNEKKEQITILESVKPGVHCSWCANCSGIVGG